MDPELAVISFTLVYQGNSIPIRVSQNQHYSLMTLISDQLGIPGFGLCCGMGSCGTCMVNICKANETTGYNTLSCEVSINDDLNNSIVTIAEGYY